MENKEFIETALKNLQALGIDADFEEEFDPDEIPCAQISMYSDDDADLDDEIPDNDIRITTAVRVLKELGAIMESKPFHGMPGGSNAVSGDYGDMHIEVSWDDPETGVGISFTLA